MYLVKASEGHNIHVHCNLLCFFKGNVISKDHLDHTANYTKKKTLTYTALSTRETASVIFFISLRTEAACSSALLEKNTCRNRNPLS